MKVIIQGDFHLTNKDGERLFEQITEETGCVFKEGRSDAIYLSNLTRSYSVFVIGIIQLAGIMWGGRRTSPMEERLSELGIDYDDAIDKEFHESFKDFPILGHIVALSIFPLYLIFGVNQDPTSGIKIGPFIASTFAIALFILLLAFPLLYFTLFTLIEVIFIGGRDRYMAKSVINKSKNEGYDEVGVFVGQLHVSGMKKIFKDEGWEVETNPSWVHPKQYI